MRRKVIKSASARLATAQRAVDSYCAATSSADAREHWYEFLLAASGVYEKLKAAANEAGGSHSGWYGKILHVRKSDPLLAYVHHARDVEYHGVEDSTKGEPRYVEIIPGMGYMVDSFEDEDQEYAKGWHAPGARYSVGGKTVSRDDAEHLGMIPPVPNVRMKLVTVVDARFKVAFDPPENHLGTPIDGTNPASVAKATLLYLEGIVAEALARVSE